MFPVLEQPDVGTYPVTNIPIRFSRSGLEPPKPAPAMGADNEAIYGALGVSAEELQELKNKQVI